MDVAEDHEGSSEDICRVCRLSGSQERPLFHPCLCTGSIRYIHQDCLVQWLRHSRKEYCELCHYKFQFASIYRSDMPRWLPVNYVYKTLAQALSQKLQKWFHFCFVIFMWLYFLPVCTYRIYGVMFNGALWSAIKLPIDIITFDNLILECLMGLLIVVVSLLSFISLVWLRDQLTNGNGPDWLTADQQLVETPRQEGRGNPRAQLVEEAQRQLRLRQNSSERKDLSEKNTLLKTTMESLISELRTISLKKLNDETVDLRTRIYEISYMLKLPMTHCMPILRSARLQNIRGVEKWRESIFADLRSKRLIPPDIGGLPIPAADEINRQPLPSLIELGLNFDEATLFSLYKEPPPILSDEEVKKLELELAEIQSRLKTAVELHLVRQKSIAKCLYTGDIDIDGMSNYEKAVLKEILEIKKQTVHQHQEELNLMTGQNKTVREMYPVLGEQTNQRQFVNAMEADEPQRNVEARPARRRRHNLRPNIGHALIGLAREPQDPNAEAIQADQLTKMLGLDGTYHFLEHVMWMLVLMSVILFLFVFVPSKLGELIASRIFPWHLIWNDSWRILISALAGYILLFVGIVAFYYAAGLFHLSKYKSYLGIAYLALKISILLILEAGIFPLLCGWWMDICSFSLLGTSLKDRIEILNYAPATVMFLHWLAGMIFVFYFASFVVLLREVLRPGVLWFLRNLNDQNFHPIQDMIAQPLQRHLRRFLMSNIMFGVSILVLVFLPSRFSAFILPQFLPYNLTLMSPIREVQLELILLQFVIPSLLEHSNTRAAIKTAVKHWAQFVSKLLGLESYLLDKPQTGGAIVDMHGKVIQVLEYDSSREEPAYIGPNQVMGPGFAPFKPYLRPALFYLRMIAFIIITVVSVLSVSSFFLIVPVLLGRHLMAYVGVVSPPDIYTSAIGLYFLWALTRAFTAIVFKMKDGLKVVSLQLLIWVYQGFKCCVAAFLLFFVIPLLLGNLVNLLVISPLRVPMNKTPIIYFSTEWALGLLHMKCSCGIIWLTDTSFKQTLDQLYQRGVRNLSLYMVITEVAWPVISNLTLFITLPYVFFITAFYMTGLTSYSTCVIWYRYCYVAFFIVLITLSLLLVLIKQSSRVYNNLRNKEYLIGRQLVNYGSPVTEERTPLSVPVQETGLQ